MASRKLLAFDRTHVYNISTSLKSKIFIQPVPPHPVIRTNAETHSLPFATTRSPLSLSPQCRTSHINTIFSNPFHVNATPLKNNHTPTSIGRSTRVQRWGYPMTPRHTSKIKWEKKDSPIRWRFVRYSNPYPLSPYIVINNNRHNNNKWYPNEYWSHWVPLTPPPPPLSSLYIQPL